MKKKIVKILMGGGVLLFSLLLTSCNESNFIDENQSEDLKANQKTTITQQQAKTAAINFLNQSKSKAKGIPNINEDNIEEIQTLVDEADVPVMYILNIKENNGFIVMSASTVEKPILAYANKGKFDLENINQYDGVNDWLAIKYLKI